MNEQTITLRMKVDVEKKVTVAIGPNEDLEELANKEADKIFYQPAKELAYEDIEFVDINDVRVKDFEI